MTFFCIYNKYQKARPLYQKDEYFLMKSTVDRYGSNNSLRNCKTKNLRFLLDFFNIFTNFSQLELEHMFTLNESSSTFLLVQSSRNTVWKNLLSLEFGKIFREINYVKTCCFHEILDSKVWEKISVISTLWATEFSALLLFGFLVEDLLLFYLVAHRTDYKHLQFNSFFFLNHELLCGPLWIHVWR